MVDLKKGDKFIDLNFPEEVHEFISKEPDSSLFWHNNSIGELKLSFIKDFNIKKVEDIQRLKCQTPQKFDSGKPRMDLIRPEFTLGLGEALAYGADKYSEKVGEMPNYLKGDGFNYSKIIGSLERHIADWKMGNNIDEESNIHHLALAAANLMFLFTYEKSDKGIDDRVVLKKDK